MKLLSEEARDARCLVEETNNQKQYFIEGVFLQAEHMNRNRRIYPMSIMEREVARYTKDYINRNRAYGELQHPKSGAGINLDRVSHMIKSLVKEGRNFIGKAKIMDTPMGKIVKNFIDEGASLGVSSRGLGTLKPLPEGSGNIVQDDYYLATAADIVADPSAHDAWVQAVFENKEWVFNPVTQEYEAMDAIVSEVRQLTRKDYEQKVASLFEQYVKLL